MAAAPAESPFHWSGADHPEVPLLLTAPHSGETIPPEAPWLVGIEPRVLLMDVDRFVDRLYVAAAERLPVPFLSTRIHRYACDLNRYPEDVDASSVRGAPKAAGTFPQGFHWTRTTQGDPLLASPIAEETHATLARLYHDRFHEEIGARLATLRSRFPASPVFHLDCHSMPSQGTGAHQDAGQRRPEVCISDYNGKSANAPFRDLVLESFRAEGFDVSLNWPYQGGRITQRYGRPAQGTQTIQIELNRALYLDERTRDPLPGFDAVAERLASAVGRVAGGLKGIH